MEEKSAVIGFLEGCRGERNIWGDGKNLVVCFTKLDSCHYAGHNGGGVRLQDGIECVQDSYLMIPAR